MAIKYNEDDYYANTFYAKVGGISLDEINQLEYDFLSMCNFSMSVKLKKFQKYHEYLSQFTDWLFMPLFYNSLHLKRIN